MASLIMSHKERGWVAIRRVLGIFVVQKDGRQRRIYIEYFVILTSGKNGILKSVGMLRETISRY